MLITKQANLITVINVFETTSEQQQQQIDAWIGTGAMMIPLLFVTAHERF